MSTWIVNVSSTLSPKTRLGEPLISHLVGAVGDVAELELEAVAGRAQLGRGICAVEARLQAAQIAGVLDGHEHLRRGRAVPLLRRAGDLRALAYVQSAAPAQTASSVPPTAVAITRVRGRRIRRI